MSVEFLTYKESVNFFKNKIRKKELFSVSRIGDGEISLLLNKHNKQIEKKVCKNWGYSYETEASIAAKDARSMLLRAMLKSDVIGFLNLTSGREHKIPTGRGLVGGPHWLMPDSFFVENNIDVSKKIIIDHQFFRSYEFGYIENFKKIIGNKSIHIISPNADKVVINLSKYLNNNIKFTKINKSTKFRQRRKEFNIIKRNVKEDLVLYGGGLGNKDLGVILKEELGVSSMDVGATLDAWAGILSRPWFRPGRVQDYLVLPKKKRSKR